jgi:transcription elongation GreA/GreB family factor
MASPIGKALADKKPGEEVVFMGRTIKIADIA